MDRQPRIMYDHEALAALCRRWHIKRLAFFGSVMRDDFGPDSDIDILYEFEEGRTLGWEFIEVADAFAAFFVRKVDLVSFSAIDKRLKKYVLADAQLQYDAGSPHDPRPLLSDQPAPLSGSSRFKHDNLVYVGQMVDAARSALSWTAGRERDWFLGDELVQAAVQRQLQIVGRVAGRLPWTFREGQSGVPWQAIDAINSDLLSDILNVDSERVWEAMRTTLPVVMGQLEPLIPSEDD